MRKDANESMPAAGKLILDTNVVIALIEGDSAVASQVRDCREVFIPSIVLGELYYGAFRSSRVKENIDRIEALMKERVIIGCDHQTAERYGMIKSELRMKGRPLPENDIWIAAIAMQHNVMLASRDQHFREIEGLAWEAV